MKPAEKKIIIGKNSKISKLLAYEVPEITQISHIEAFTFDFSNYDQIYFIGWNNKKPLEVLGLLNWIDIKKVIFISTIAIFSTQLRQQWANYPLYKRSAENLVLNGGGRVIRLGRVTATSIPSPYFTNTSPITPLSLIVEHIKKDANYKILNLFYLAPRNTRNIDRLFSRFLHNFSRLLPSQALFQAPIVILAKLLRINSYGYGSDAEKFIYNSIQIGFGALGSSYFRKHNSDAVFIASTPNIDLVGSGFSGTLIGRLHKGLGAFWHGATIKKLGETDSYTKYVPLYVRRPSPPALITQKLNVVKIKYEFKRWQVTSFDSLGNSFDHFCNQLTLAAGPIENTRLLSCLEKIDTSFDDHFTFFAGIMNTEDAMRKNLITKFGPFMVRKRVLSVKEGGVSYLCDIRPHTNRKNDNEQFYIARTASIIKKLIMKADPLLINEAFFNKFGISFFTKTCSAYIQFLAKDNIDLSSNEGCIIKISKKIPCCEETLRSINSKLPSIKFHPEIRLIDTQHVVGGKSVLKSKLIQSLCSEGALKIIGSPTTFELTAHHHTNELRNFN